MKHVVFVAIRACAVRGHRVRHTSDGCAEYNLFEEECVCGKY
jgi:hypothetical protein